MAGEMAERLMRARSGLNKDQRSELADVENELQRIQSGRTRSFFGASLQGAPPGGAARALLDRRSDFPASKFLDEVVGGVVGQAVPPGAGRSNEGVEGFLNRRVESTLRKELEDETFKRSDQMRKLLDRRDEILGLREPAPVSNPIGRSMQRADEQASRLFNRKK